jgi:azurin
MGTKHVMLDLLLAFLVFGQALARGVNAARFNAAATMARDSEFVPLDRKGEMIAYTGLAGGGETVEVTFTVPDRPGTYAFICTFPGHFNLGMKGELVVK